MSLIRFRGIRSASSPVLGAALAAALGGCAVLAVSALVLSLIHI
ncbi:MAG: hypothetical protein QUU85_18470 [Candidatus Eisenbacteria bacterium]|nr:hypothetical protein [Candidatus Eisenbacteria bacterium]